MPVVGDAEEPVGLDHLQPLVHQRGRVDRDLAAHRPGGVGKRRLHGDVAEARATACRGMARRRPSGSGARTSSPRERPRRLPEGAVLAVDRANLDAVGVRRGGDQLAGADDRLLVGEGNDLAGFDRAVRSAGWRRDRRWRRRRCRRPDGSPPRSTPRHPGLPGAAGRSARRRRRRQASEVGTEVRRLLGEQRGVAAGGEGDDAEAVRMVTRSRRASGCRSNRSSRGRRRRPVRQPLAAPSGRHQHRCRGTVGGGPGHSVRSTSEARNQPAVQVKSSASIRSSMPPWPGISVPLSLTPAWRLSSDSARSPMTPMTPRTSPTDESDRPRRRRGRRAATASDAGHRGRGQATGQPLDRLLRADGRDQRSPAERSPDEVGAGVAEPGDAGSRAAARRDPRRVRPSRTRAQPARSVSQSASIDPSCCRSVERGEERHAEVERAGGGERPVDERRRRDRRGTSAVDQRRTATAGATTPSSGLIATAGERRRPRKRATTSSPATGTVATEHAGHAEILVERDRGRAPIARRRRSGRRAAPGRSRR